MRGPKAISVDERGEEDGFVVRPGWLAEMTPAGDTRIVVSVPHVDLPRVHAALCEALAPPIGVLYRQKIDRATPKPQGAPGRDYVALGKALTDVLATLSATEDLVYGDARHELWLRGALGEQLVMDQDGLLYCYPDDPAFRDVLQELGIPGEDVETIADRDYVKHWYHAENDQLEGLLLEGLRLVEVPHQG